MDSDLALVPQSVEKIRVGTNYSSAALLIPSAILAFRQAMPSAEFTLHEGSLDLLAMHYMRRKLLHIVPIRLPLVFGPLGIIMHRSLTLTPALKLLVQRIRNTAPSLK